MAYGPHARHALGWRMAASSCLESLLRTKTEIQTRFVRQAPRFLLAFRRAFFLPALRRVAFVPLTEPLPRIAQSTPDRLEFMHQAPRFLLT